MSFKKGLWSGAAHYWQLQNPKTYAFSLGVKDPVCAELDEYRCRCRCGNNMPVAETYEWL